MLWQFKLIEQQKDIFSDKKEKLKQQRAHKMFLWYREFQV